MPGSDLLLFGLVGSLAIAVCWHEEVALRNLLVKVEAKLREIDGENAAVFALERTSTWVHPGR